MQLNVVLTLIGTVEVEGPVLTNNSGKTFKTAEVFDINGNLVIRVNKNQLKSKINQLDISQLASGLYNFVITYDGKSINKKVIKQ